jgi:hypothetical protein
VGYKFVRYFKCHIIIQTARVSQTKLHDDEDLIQRSKKKKTHVNLQKRIQGMPVICTPFNFNTPKTLQKYLIFNYEILSSGCDAT